MIAPLDQHNGRNAEQMKPSIAVVDIGNSSIALALWSDGKVSHHQDLAGGRIEPAGEALKGLAGKCDQGGLNGVVIVSVVPDVVDRLGVYVQQQMDIEPLVVGRTIPLPMEVKLPHAETVGVDRICCAAAAFERNKESCVVVDLGTAVTIDMVDSDGAFVGGAILPGLGMQTRALHQHTAVLPEVTPQRPSEVIGQDTRDAISSGVYYGTAGAIRHIVEAYAAHTGRWPPVVATGGDASLIAAECGIFDAVVPDLCLLGAGLAYRKWLDGAVQL